MRVLPCACGVASGQSPFHDLDDLLSVTGNSLKGDKGTSNTEELERQSGDSTCAGTTDTNAESLKPDHRQRCRNVS